MALTEKESYDNTLFYFRKTLHLLAESPTAQCDTMRGSPHVAWELSRDVIGLGRLLLSVSKERLTEKQKRKVETLVVQVERFPSALTRGMSSYADNVKAMEDPFWAPLRGAATELLTALPYINETSSFG
jgi:hypothetical protein